MTACLQLIKRHPYWLLLLLLAGSIFTIPVSANSDLPRKAYVSGVAGHPQTYPLSCESRSAVDWAAFFGVEIGEKKFLNHLPRSDNPDRGFVGNPNDPLGNIPPRSYGVHAGPVAALLNEYGLSAAARINFEWEQVQAELAEDRPVIVWVIGQMWDGIPIAYTSSAGEEAQVAHYEHTMILVGYAPRSVSAIDAATGQESTYALSSFLDSWQVLGRMAIVFSKPEADGAVASEVEQPVIPTQVSVPGSIAVPDPSIETSQTVMPVQTEIPVMAVPTLIPTTAEETQIYTVRRGDYLTGIARQFGVNWRKLARLNRLTAPYTLYTGQKLRIP